MKKLLLLLMFFGTSVVWAQVASTDCPVVEKAVQTFCQSEGTGNNFYQPAVRHLEATADGASIAWYDTADSTEPLSPDDILLDGENYYAGNINGTCQNRAVVDVTVYAAPNAGATTIVTFCSNDDPKDLLELYRPSILGPPDTGGTFVPALASGSSIFDPSVDPAGKYTYIVSSPNAECPDDSSVIFIRIEQAPNAGEDANIKMQRSDSPVDLFTLIKGAPDAGGAWSPVLVSGTGIFDPTVDQSGSYFYTLAGGAYCGDSVAVVTVNIGDDDPGSQNCPLVENPVQSFCESEGTGNNFYRPAVKHLQATINGSEIAWYDTADSTEPLSPDDILLDGGDYYAGNVDGSCTVRPVVNVNIDDAPNAGKTTFLTLCSNDAPFDLIDVYEPSILGPPDAGGTFKPSLKSGTTIFDPAVDLAGEYTYTVESTNSACPDDSSSITIIINNCQDGVLAVQVPPSGEELSQINVVAFPNPSTGNFKFSHPSLEVMSIRIIDSRGTAVKTFMGTTNREQTEINISDLKTGVYISEIITSSGTVTKRLLKN